MCVLWVHPEHRRKAPFDDDVSFAVWCWTCNAVNPIIKPLNFITDIVKMMRFFVRGVSRHKRSKNTSHLPQFCEIFIMYHAQHKKRQRQKTENARATNTAQHYVNWKYIYGNTFNEPNVIWYRYKRTQKESVMSLPLLMPCIIIKVSLF